MAKSRIVKHRAAALSVGDDVMDVIEIILEDHKPLKALIKVIKNPDRPLSERRAAFNKFAPLLIAHAKPEEKALYRFMKRDAGLRELGLEGDTEHALAEQLLGETEQTDADDLFSARIKVLAELVEHHIAEEESKLFPELRRRISLEVRATLADEYLISQQEVETETQLFSRAERKSALRDQYPQPLQAH